MSNWKAIAPSKESQRTLNKIRVIVDQLDLKNINDKKPIINLSLGDPACYGNMDPAKHVVDAMTKVVLKNKSNGYAHSWGVPSARKAVAGKYSVENAQLTENDVIITSSCSGALEMSIAVLGNEGDNMLLPSPGFGIYETICGNKGIEPRFYNLLAEKEWEIDLKQMESLIDNKTKALVICNPSNPCGSVWSREHLIEIAKIAEKHHIPVISDEVYARMTFGREFVSFASVTTKVPVLTCGGLAKQYLVPGWRVGWILIFDRDGIFKDVRDGLGRLTTLILGANTLVQNAMEEILSEPQDYIKGLNTVLEKHAMFAYERCSKIKGLSMVKPYGAMYGMIKIHIEMFKEEIKDDLEFSKLILKEESIQLLPGMCFNIRNFVRIVLVAPEEKLAEAFDRLESFCDRYRK